MTKPQEPVILAKDVPDVIAPPHGPGSKIHWDNPDNDPNRRPTLETTGQLEAQAAEFGPGSKVNWDNPKLDPTKRKHVGLDPTGVLNAKLL
jgi:hypothetical protein